MTNPITIERIELAAFRAFLEPQTILLRNRKKTNVAIFGRNGTGKSSLIDSLEYYFSERGTLGILGKKKTETQAGPAAIRHLNAKADVGTYVHMSFKQGEDEFGDLHPFSSRLTNAAERVLRHTKVPFIIRENDLNRFVLATKPNERYNELAGWLRMETLSKIQDNLKALRKRLKDESGRNGSISERLKDLGECTGGKILEWDEPKILDWLNENVLSRLGVKNRFKTLSEKDPAFQELKDLAEIERKQTNPDNLRNLLATINGLHAQSAVRQENPVGKIAMFEAAASDFNDASSKEERIRDETKESVFNEVWKSAKVLLGDRNDLDRCPVCETEFSASPHGSRDSVRANISDNLSKLDEYAKAEKEKDHAEAHLNAARQDLEKELVKFLAQAGSTYPHGDVDTYGKSLEAWRSGKGVPDSTNVLDALADLRASVEGMVERFGQNGECSFGDAFDKVQELLEITAKLDLITRTKEEMSTAYDAVTEQSNAFNGTIAEHIQNRVGILTSEMNAIYKDIRGSDDVPSIRIALGKEGGVEQRTAQLFIDLEEHKGLPPSGFQSQSQINTLALAFRLAAIRMFNDAKIIILDDVVSSYDEEHRSNIATVLDEHFRDFQIVLSTHEKTFFDSLQYAVDKNRWQFREIQYLKPGYGPIFDDHKTDIEKIKEKHGMNETAGNNMRRLVEKRLYDICADFQTQIKIRKNGRYEMEELKASLNNFLNKKNLAVPKNPYGESILEILGRMSTLNRGSHYRHGQSSSVGDEKHDLKIIEYFLGLFTCPKCGRDRFVRKNGMPTCRHKKCGAEFSFQH